MTYKADYFIGQAVQRYIRKDVAEYVMLYEIRQAIRFESLPRVLPDGLENDCSEFQIQVIKTERKINDIKKIRELTSFGLKESKDLWEADEKFFKLVPEDDDLYDPWVSDLIDSGYNVIVFWKTFDSEKQQFLFL